MTAPRTREHANPPSPPERRPPRRGGGSSPSPYIYASAAGRPAGPARLFGARRGLVRSARALAAAALLALSGALALPATAQAVVLVSNFGRPVAPLNATVGTYQYAKCFSTGTNTGGYNLTSLELDVKVVPASTANLTVAIYSSTTDSLNNKVPDAEVVALAIPTLSVGTNTFAAPANTVLDPSTSGARKHYCVFIADSTSTGTTLELGRADNSQADTLQTGWSLENGYRRTTGAWAYSTTPHKLRVRLNGTAVSDTPTLSTDATLSALSVTGGGSELVTFASGTYTYTASVANGVEEVTVAPVTNHASATVGYLLGDAGDEDDLEDADAMEDDFQVALAVGANRIVVSVTAEDGTTYLDYVVTVTRAAAMTPACTVTPGDLWCGVVTIGTTTFPGTSVYGYVDVGSVGSLSPNSFTHEGTPITVLKVTYNVLSGGETDLEVGTSPALPSGYNFVLQVGSQSFAFAGGVSPYFFTNPSGVDWSMSDGETVTLRLRETPSENATLSGLAVNDGSSDLALSPAFAPDNTSYTAWVPNAVDEVTVTPTTLNSNATIAWLDGSDMTLADADAAAGQQVALSEGENVIKVQVTSQDGTAMETYMVTVTRAVAPPATPTGLMATAGNRRVALAWTAPAAGADITHHEYRYKTDSDYQDNWKKIPYSATGGFNEDGFTVTGLDNGTAHTFQLRAVNSGGESGSVESSATTPSGHGRIVESISLRRYDNQDGEPYGIGDRIVFVVKLSQGLGSVSNPSNARVLFDIGSTRKNADNYSGTSGSTSLWYDYYVVEGDVDNDGIEIPAGPTALPNTYYSDAAGSNSFDESGITAQGPFPDRKVDGVYPSLDSAVVNGTVLVLTWDETLRDDSVPAAGDFTVTVAGASRSVTGLVFADGAVSLVLASAVRAGETVTVSYTKGTNPLKDLASNEAPALTDQAVTNNTAPPDAPTDFNAAVGDAQVTLSWDKPESDSGVTKHQYQFKTGDGAYGGWQDIADSGVGGANEKSFTKTGLTNEVVHTFQLRAVNAAGDSDAVESDAVTPTPGICGRTQKVHEAIVYYLDADVGVTRTCAAVNVADLASLTRSMEMQGEGITSLRPGDFAGLTSLQTLDLSSNSFTTLPAGVFSGMTALTTIKLKGGALTSLPANVFSGLPALEILELEDNSNLASLDADVFNGLTALITLWLHENDLTSLPADVFDGLTALESLVLRDNDLTSLDARQFSDLTALVHLELAGNDLTSLPAGTFDSLTLLTTLTLNGNDLTSLPDGAFSGLTALTTLPLGDNPNTDDDLPLTVTVEKVGTDQVRAKVLAGAPFDVDFTPTVANGSLPASDTKLAVDGGDVDGTAETVTRTSGTMAAVTVDIDLTTQPTLPTNHSGYTFAKAAGSEPVEILPDTRGPQNLTAAPGDGQAVLAWDAPPSGSGVTKHQYRFKTTGSYPTSWTDVPNSAVGEANEDGYTVPNLTNETAYTFELRWLVGASGSATAESNTVTPTPGICDRTQQVREAIIYYVESELGLERTCAEVTVADLAGLTFLEAGRVSIGALKSGDFEGLTSVTTLELNGNTFTTLPANLFSDMTSLVTLNLNSGALSSIDARAFSGLTSLQQLKLDQNELGSLPNGVFSGLTALQGLILDANDLTSLPAGVFSGLTSLLQLNLQQNKLSSLPANVFSRLSALRSLGLQDNDLTSLPAGVFDGLTALAHLALNGNDLDSLPAGAFTGLSVLNTLVLQDNDLTSLPAGTFTGLTALTKLNLGDNPDTGDVLRLTVTVEKVGTDQVRAKVLAGAPFAVDFTPTVANGSLPASDTKLAVPAGSVEGTPVTVTRTSGTTEAVTVDIDLTTQPTLPVTSAGDVHEGYVFARSSDLPVEILPEEATIDPPTNFNAAPGADQEAVLSWTPPPANSGYTRHEYRYQAGSGSFTALTPIPDSGPGGANGRGFTVTGLAGLVEHTFELRAASDDGRSRALTARVTPTGDAVVTLYLSDNEPLEDLLAVTVTATVLPATPVAFTVEISASPVAPATDDDFTLSTNRTLSFAANATGSTGTVRIDPVADEDPEPNDVVTVSGVVSNPAIPNPDAVRLTILNDDADLPQDLAIDAPAAVDEGAGTVDVTVTMTTRQNTAPVIDAQLFYRQRPGTATRGDDYTRPQSLGNRIAIVPISAFSANAAGTAWVARHSFEIGIVDDGEAERDETIVFEIYNISGNRGIEQTIVIRDDDAIAPGGPTGLTAFSKSQTRIQLAWTAPGNHGSFAITGYRVEASEDAGSSWNAVARTRDARTDFRHGGLSAGDTRHYRVLAVSDAGASAPSDVASATTLSSSSPAATNANLPPPADVTAAPKLPRQIRLGWWTPTSGGSIDSYRYRMRAVDAGDWTAWTRVNRGADAFHSVFVDDLDAGTTYEFQVRSVDKDADYSTTVSALATATGRPTISIAAPSGTVTEGEPLRFTLSRDQPHGRMYVILQISETGDMLSLEGRRPNGLWTKGFYFGDGNAAIQVVLDTVDDRGGPEPDSRVTVEVMPYPLYPGNPDNEELYSVHERRGSATKKVTARSAALSVADAQATEGADATLDFTVRLLDAAASEVTVDYRTEDVTATAGSDYTARSGTLRFAPGDTEKTVSVPILDDAEPDDGETFTLVLSNASGARIADARATGTIRNTEEEPEEVEPEVEEPEEEEPENTPAQGTPTIAGEARVGDTLTTTTSDITDADGLDNAEFAYQWIRGGADIPGATGASYTAVDADEGKRLKVRVGFTDDAGNEESLTSAATDAVAARPQPEISVADARADEGAGATLDFEVTLSAPAPGPVTVDYRTLDASAKAGADYAARQGTLTFRAGETMKTVSVPVLDDSHDEGREILVLMLDNARGGVLADRIGVGTIENADPLQRAWLSRFGRMAALQVVDHVEARMAARREPGFRGRFAGRELRRGMERDIALSFLQRLGRTAAPGPIGGVATPTGGMATPTGGMATPTGGMATPTGGVATSTGGMATSMGGGSVQNVGLDWGRLLRTGLGGGDLLTGSDFALDRLTDRGGIVSFWSRGSMSRFSGREGALSLGGDVRTTMFGADYAQGPLTAGLMLSHSRGLGEYAGVDGGVLHSSVTGLFPWLGYRASGRVSAWAVTGYGSGGLMLTPDGVGALESGLSMAMAAVGARGALAGVAAASGGTGFGLSFKADALWVGTSIDGVDGAAGSLKATASSATRVRTALEASGGFILGGLSLKPSVEAGLRHDGGDAETGSGLDLGGGLAASVSSTGLTVEVRLRTLLAHEAEGYSERGASVQLSWNPSPSTPLGFNARLSPSWGVRATGGAEALWGRETMAGVGARNGPAAGNRLDVEAGYGLPLGGGFVGTPRVGVRTSESGRDYLLGWSVGVLGGGALNLSLGVDAHRRESPRAGGAAHGVAGRVGVRW